MNLTLVISDNCEACERAKEMLQSIKSKYPQVLTEMVHVNVYTTRKISITPAWLINNKLFSYGDIDERKLTSKIN